MALFVFMVTILLLLITIIKRDKFFGICTLASVGILCMISANFCYFTKMTNVSINGLNYIYSFLDVIPIFRSISISNIRVFSLLGEICIIVSFVLSLKSIGIKNRLLYNVLISFVILYFIFGLPSVMYEFYIKINTKASESFLSKNLWEIISVAKVTGLIILAILPYIFSVCKYINTKFLVIKRQLLFKNLALGIIELLILLMIYFNVINDMITSYEILYMGAVVERYETNGFLISILFVIVLVLFIALLIAGITYNNYSPSKIYSMYISRQMNKNLRMILHTYKNMFFSSYQMISLISEENISKETKDTLDSVKELNQNALFSITRQIKSFDNFEFNYGYYNISNIISNTIEKFKKKEKDMISVSYCDAKYKIYTDEFYIIELLYNVLKNSLEAVEGLSEPKVDINVYKEDKWIMFEIVDNGCGIKKKEMKQIFKPLISYKCGSENWGIGLYYAYRISLALRGHLYVKSKFGVFTKFQIYLPVISNKNID